MSRCEAWSAGAPAPMSCWQHLGPCSLGTKWAAASREDDLGDGSFLTYIHSASYSALPLERSCSLLGGFSNIDMGCLSYSFVRASHLLASITQKVGSAARVGLDWISLERGGGKAWLWEGICVQSCQNASSILFWEDKWRFGKVYVSQNLEGNVTTWQKAYIWGQGFVIAEFQSPTAGSREAGSLGKG